MMMKNEGINNRLNNDSHQREEILNKMMKTQNSLRSPLSEKLSDVKKRLQKLKQGIVKMRRPVFLKDGTSRARVIRWEEVLYS